MPETRYHGYLFLEAKQENVQIMNIYEALHSPVIARSSSAKVVGRRSNLLHRMEVRQDMEIASSRLLHKSPAAPRNDDLSQRRPKQGQFCVRFSRMTKAPVLKCIVLTNGWGQ
ncbi:hypothetical protein EG028_00190 [Chitinophaga barathri]|uniref:Uncharacterized protein n=1 Tax=Chitinophaga barathri TaxID=1647451 RepID=A0A3N4MFL9_9BACT|nr:hypothetical protein EG028_00190 [Chitinophaga barathri]